MAYQKKLSEQDNKYRAELISYVTSLYLNNGWDEADINYPMLTAQMKHMVDDGINYAWLLYTLQYMIETIEFNVFEGMDNGSILNLIPFYYPQAKEFWHKCNQIKNMVNENFDTEEKTNVVSVKKNDIRNFHFKNIDF